MTLLLNALLLSALVVAPGWLLWWAWLRERGFSWRVSVGLVLAVDTILLTNLAALFGYSLALALLVTGGVLLAAIVTAIIRRPTLDIEAPDWHRVAFHALLVAVYLAPALVLYLPLDTDGQGFGHIALMIREGGTISTMAPWMPDVRYLYSPGLFIWWALFSDVLGMPLHEVMLGFTHLMGGLLLLFSIDLGRALLPDSERAGWLFPLLMTVGTGMFLRVMDSAYTSVMATLFVVLFLTVGLRALRSGEALGWAAAALACVTLTHPDTIIILLLAYIPFYATFWLAKSGYRTWDVWLRFFVMIPGLGVLLCAPWALTVLPLFFAEGVVSPFPLSWRHIVNLTLYQGLLIVPFALGGAVLAARRRALVDVLMLTWLVFIVDFSLFGIVERIVLVTGFDVMRYAYPHSIAWAGPPIPYAYFAALAVEWLLERRPIELGARWVGGLSAAGLAVIMLAVIFHVPVLNATAPHFNFFGTFSSRADVAAMTYLRENTPPDALVLNYPSGFEAHWVPTIAERDAIAFRDQPFFDGAEPYYERHDAFREVYFDLRGAQDQLEAYGVTHVIIPQMANNPDVFGDFEQMIRWRWPAETWVELETHPSELDWLALVFDEGGAQVYEVLQP